MPDKVTTETLQAATEKRVLNEFHTKAHNEEKLEKISEAGGITELSPHAPIPFRCECDDEACGKTIQMSTEEYMQAHRKTKNFVVIPRHVRLDLEEVVTAFSNYVIVGKIFPIPKAG